VTTSYGTATDHDDLFELLRTFLTSGIGTGENWTELDYSTGDRSVLFQAPGLSGTEEIHVGLQLYESTGDDVFGFYGWMFRAYDSGLAHWLQPGTSAQMFHPTLDTSIPYWFFANGQRVIVVTKCSTVYTSSYIGKFLQYGTPGEYGQPYYLGMPYSVPGRFSLENQSFRNFWDPGIGAQVLQPNGSWVAASNFVDVAGAETNASSGNFVHPYQDRSGSTSVKPAIRWRELRNNIDGTYTRFPLILTSNYPTPDIYGELDGAYAVSGFGTVSEDDLTIGGDTYLVFQDTYRTARYNYAAILEA
jgi:hypothetical protein